MALSFRPQKLSDLRSGVSLTTEAQGDILYRGATKWNNLAAGTSGQVLTSGGAGANPSWQDASAGVSLSDNNTWTGIQTFSNASTVFGAAGTAPTLSVPNASSGAGNDWTFQGSSAGSGNSDGGDFVFVPGALAGSGTNGKVRITDPAQSNELQIYVASSTATYLNCTASGALINLVSRDRTYSFGDGFSAGFSCGAGIDLSGNLRIDVSGYVGWGFDSPVAGSDTTIRRSASGVLAVTNAAGSAAAAILSSVLVEANTAGSGAPNVLTAVESGTVLTNEGVTAQNYHTLPTAVAGLQFTFVVQDSDGIRVVANTGDTIRIAGSVSASAGYIQNSTVGSMITLVAINATEWIATAQQGTWTIDS